MPDDFNLLMRQQLAGMAASMQDASHELHLLAKSVSAMTVHVDNLRLQVEENERHLALLDVRINAAEEKLRRLEPINRIAEQVISMLVKAMAYGIVFLLILYFTRIDLASLFLKP